MEITVRLLQEEPTLLQSIIDFIQDPSAWLSIISVVIAIMALFQTQRQIKLSNKQQLFDRRLTDYLIAKDVINSQIKDYIKNGESFDATKILFDMMTPSFFVSIRDAPFELTDNRIRNSFYAKLQELENIGEEMVIIFDKENIEPLKAFFKAYCDAAGSIHTYIDFCYLKDNNIPFSAPDEPLSKNVPAFVEKKKENAIMWFDKLKTAYETLEKSKVMDNLPKYLKL